MNQLGRAWRRWPAMLAAGVLLAGLPSDQGVTAETGPRFQNFTIPSESMEPTLRTREQFIVQTSNFLPIERGGVYLVRKRGVIFAFRVIGLPGEEIEFTGGGVFQKEKAAYYSDEGVAGLTGTCPRGPALIRREHLHGGASHAIMACDHSFGPDMSAIKIPAGHYFLLGDNRSNAADSRFTGPDFGLGLVAEADFVGKALRILVSNDVTRMGKAID